MNDPAAQYQPKLLSSSGRIGRLRFMAYNAMVGSLLLLFLRGLSPLVHQVAAALVYLMYLALIPFTVMIVVLAVRRLHDLDIAGWWAAAMFIPLLNLGVLVWLCSMAGKDGANRYGYAPSPNTMAVKIFAWVYAGLMVYALVATPWLAQNRELLMGAVGAGRANSDIEAGY